MPWRRHPCRNATSDTSLTESIRRHREDATFAGAVSVQMLSRQPDRHQGMHYPFIGNPAGRGLPRDAGKAHQTQVASLLPDVAHSKVEPIIPRHVCCLPRRATGRWFDQGEESETRDETVCLRSRLQFSLPRPISVFQKGSKDGAVATRCRPLGGMHHDRGGVCPSLKIAAQDDSGAAGAAPWEGASRKVMEEGKGG